MSVIIDLPGGRQISRLLSAIWRARRSVPSVSAIFRLAASSLLIVRRADMTFGNLTIGLTVTVGPSGVFMSLIGFFLSKKINSVAGKIIPAISIRIF
ncbi:hypothetical protein [Mesorhizobium metallidurans]|uniref:hypothetical protein n=1 Tax=Mesorhizobium metallidurans TaxID=489722 RepID=UPI0012FBB397|nr:hypothetical protein [Mesorhizobium metallidurans]